MRLSKFTTAYLEATSICYRDRQVYEVADIFDELIDRRAEAESAHRKLEAGLAYDYASSLIVRRLWSTFCAYRASMSYSSATPQTAVRAIRLCCLTQPHANRLN